MTLIIIIRRKKCLSPSHMVVSKWVWQTRGVALLTWGPQFVPSHGSASPGQCASALNVHTNSLGILWKGRFRFSRSGCNLRFCFSNNSQMLPVFPDHTVVARPMDGIMSMLSKRGHSYIQGLSRRKGEAEWRGLPWWPVSLLLTVLGWNLSYTAMPSARTSAKCNPAGQPCTQLPFCYF